MNLPGEIRFKTKQASIDSKVPQHEVLITKLLVERDKSVVMDKDRCLL